MTSEDFDWEVEALRLQRELFEARRLLRQVLSISNLDIVTNTMDDVRDYLRVDE